MDNFTSDVYESSDLKPFVMWGNSQISKIFAKCENSKSFFPNRNEMFKEAVSMARYVQNPTAEVLNL